jgi:hypothetical protein
MSLNKHFQDVFDGYLDDFNRFKNDYDPNYKGNEPQRPKSNYKSAILLERTIPDLIRSNVLDYVVKGSAGAGGVVSVNPWVALFDSQITKSATKGYYIVYLFSSDMSGVYLSLNQGWTQFQKRFKTKEGRIEIYKNAQTIRDLIKSDQGFTTEDIDLKPKSELGVGYELGHILGKYYKSGELPSESQMLNDLHNLKGVYRELKGKIKENIFYSHDIEKNKKPDQKKLKKAIDKIKQYTEPDDWEEATDDDLDEIHKIAVKIRKGQPKFRKNLLKLYDGKCAITNCNISQVLEAAHIIKHSKSGINHSKNGILLRSDIHSLFDLKKIRINPNNNHVEVDRTLKDSIYWKYNNKIINSRIDGQFPGKNYLEMKYLADEPPFPGKYIDNSLGLTNLR